MNNYPIATILGGGGFIGRYLVRNLTNKQFRCIIPTRKAFQKGYLKTQAPPGSVELIDFNAKNFDKIEEAISNSDVVINLIGILFENRKQKFTKIHSDIPDIISRLCEKHKVKKGILMKSLRIAFFGCLSGPDLIQSWELFSESKVDISRIERCLISI